jgi:hypothetical protein
MPDPVHMKRRVMEVLQTSSVGDVEAIKKGATIRGAPLIYI